MSTTGYITLKQKYWIECLKDALGGAAEEIQKARDAISAKRIAVAQTIHEKSQKNVIRKNLSFDDCLKIADNNFHQPYYLGENAVLLGAISFELKLKTQLLCATVTVAATHAGPASADNEPYPGVYMIDIDWYNKVLRAGKVFRELDKQLSETKK
jgi:hypothetical protein